MKKSFLSFMAAVMLACFFPVCVYAEEVTYTEFDSGSCYVVWQGYSSGRQRRSQLHVNSTVRAVGWKNNPANTGYAGYAYVSTSPFSINQTQVNGWEDSCEYNPNINYGTSATQREFDGETYYVVTYSSGSGTLYMPVVYNDSEYTTNWQIAIFYTYGDGAVAPSDPVDWGQLRDISYTTSVAGSNEASMANKDIISWGYPFDTNNNNIEECEVEIRVVRGHYTASSKTDLFTKKAVDFVLENSNLATLGVYPASQKKVEYTWSSVCSRLSIANFWKLTAHLDNEYWLKEGWIYQARLVNSNDSYVGEWQTLYTGTSASASGSEAIITNNNFTIEVNQAFQEIIEINNNPSITIIYIDTDYTIENPNAGEEPTGGTSLWDILKQLISGIFQILAKLGDLVSGLIDGLFELLRSLFTPPDSIDETVNQTFELNINNYIQEDQNDIHQLHLALKQFELDLKQIANNYGSGDGSCVITWEDVSIDLSAFNAGEVKFINGGSYDFGVLFVDMIEGFGFSYSQYQFFVSGVIYIFLIVLINHKIVGFLRKS